MTSHVSSATYEDVLNAPDHMTAQVIDGEIILRGQPLGLAAEGHAREAFRFAVGNPALVYPARHFVAVGATARIVSLRIEAARRNPGPLSTLSHASLSKLILQFGDDLRAMEGYLYDRFQSLEAPCDVEL